MKGVTFVVILAVLCISVSATLHHHSKPPMRNGAPVIPCATDDVFRLRIQEETASNCTTRGKCDKTIIRDATSINEILISTAVHLMRSRTGESPDGVDLAQVNKFVERMNTAFGSYGILFNTTIYTHDDNEFYCIPAYSGTNQDWLNGIDDMKKEYAVNVGQTLNIFISCQTPSLQGTLFGIGTFPWDTAALKATGGLWLNSISVNTAAQLEGDITAEHEAGHCLGLWHTFHGSDEVIACGLACEETPHNDIDPAANEVGDFCADTPATPRNYACEDPTGSACNGENWGTTDYTNYMGYGMDPQPCGNHFTDQQKMRMHCWICDALPSMVMSGCD